MTFWMGARRAGRIWLTAVLLAVAISFVFSSTVTGWKRNCTLLQSVQSIPMHTVPLSAQDLLGLTRRKPTQALDVALQQLSDLESSAPSADKAVSQVARFAILLLTGNSRRVIEEANETSSDPVLGYLVAMAHGLAGDDEAVETFLRSNPYGLEYLRSTAHAAWDNRLDPDTELAIAAGEMFRRVSDSDSSSAVDIYRILAYGYERAGDRRRALEATALWIHVAPNDCAAVSWSVSLHLRDRDAQAALRQLSETPWFRLCPEYSGKMGQALDQSGNLSEAIRFYRQALLDNPQDVYAQWNLGQALYRNGQLDEAWQYIELVRKSSSPELQRAALDILGAIQGSQNQPLR